MVLGFRGIYGSKVAIVIKRGDGVGVDVREAGARKDGRHEGVDR